MKYALLIYLGTMREAMVDLSEEERTQVMSEYRAQQAQIQPVSFSE